MAGEGTSPGPVSGTLTLAPGANDAGVYSVVVCVTDGSLYDEETVQITVQAVNSPPELSPIGPQTVAEDASLNVPLSATDPDLPPQTLTFSKASGPAWATVAGPPYLFTLGPANGDAGEYAVVVQVGDGVDIDEESVVVTVEETNYPPVLAAIGPETMAEDSIREVALVATDPDGDQIAYTVASGPAWASIVTDRLRLAPPNNTVSSVPGTGMFDIVVRASDGDLYDEETVQVTVQAVNYPPELVPIEWQVVAEGESLDVPLSATDPDDDQALVFYKLSGPAWATVTGSGPSTGASGTLSLAPPDDTVEVYTVVVAVDDGVDFGQVSVQVTVEVPPGTVFVSTLGTDGPSSGTRVDPCRTIAYGLSQAQSWAFSRVVVEYGVYVETVDLPQGIDLLGGYSKDFWARDPDGCRTVIRSDGSANYSVRAVSVAAPTVFEGFVVEGQNVTTDSTNSIGVLVQDCGDALSILRNVVYVGAGGSGATGTDGQEGSAGVDGSPGLDTRTISQGSTGETNPGGAGGSLVAWDGTSLAGGRGGDADYPVYNTPQGDGEPGDNGGGAGGSGGFDGGLSSDGMTCYLPSGGVMEASPGIGGADGIQTGGVAGGSVVSGVWVAASGGPGQNAAHGGGGGGAGGSADPDFEFPPGHNWAALWGSGAGGGSGGEGGRGGQGGEGGGGAFGVFINFTALPANLPVILGNVVYCGVGGNGGHGASGGMGGLGGVGGSAGALGPGSVSWAARVGGEGGAGGHGGHGGGGAGGISAGIFVYLNGYAGPASYEIDNNVETSVGRAGSGGIAGASPAGGSSNGQPAADGTVSDVVYWP